jgi:hypothetical protein
MNTKNRHDEFRSQLQTAYRASSPDLHLDPAAMVAAGRRRRRRARVATLVGAGLVTVMATMGAAGITGVFTGGRDSDPASRPAAGPAPRSSSPAASDQTMDVPPPIQHDGPCVGTPLTIPTRAGDLHVNAPILIPNSKLASLANLTELWACADDGYAAVFASGIEVDALPGWEGVSNETQWPGYIASNGYGSLATVHKAPGLVETPDSDHRGSAQVIVNGWLIMVLGNSKLPASDLVEVANSM